VLELLPYGGVPQWTSHPPQEQSNRVRIPPGYKVLGKTAIFDLLSIVCVSIRNQGICHKNMKNRYIFLRLRATGKAKKLTPCFKNLIAFFLVYILEVNKLKTFA
jgi:hypothetical protein